MAKTILQEIDNITNIQQVNMDHSEKLIDNLIRTLNSSGIDYCHWKSNFSLAQSLSGEIDLDLLVGRRSLSLTLTILTELGFKMATATWGSRDPGIYHYYGFESHTGQLIHVHLFSRVLTGESFIKSHLLPLEWMLLANTHYTGNIKTTSKPAEFVLFILRTYIKYGSLLDLIYLWKNKSSTTDELRWLQTDLDLSVSMDLLKRYCPVVEEQLFLRCIDLLHTEGSLVKRITLARQVRNRLQIYSRHSRVKRILAYTRLLGRHFWQRLTGGQQNRILSAGGSVIAFVGPEATGKSTLVSESERWLSEMTSVKSIHAGKPPSSWLTYPVNILIPLLRKLIPGIRTSRMEGHGSRNKYDSNFSSKPRTETSLIYAFRSVILAWDRRHLLVKARRFSANGELVICDRYPSEAIGAMDSPRLHANPNPGGFRMSIYNYLARLEARLYRHIPPPDLVLQLKVSLETAKKRNHDRIKRGKESDEYLESRHRQNKNWQISGETTIRDISTEQPLSETVLLVKKTIWEIL